MKLPGDAQLTTGVAPELPRVFNEGICFNSHKDWVAVTELQFSYHSPETILFTMYPHHGNLI